MAKHQNENITGCARTVGTLFSKRVFKHSTDLIPATEFAIRSKSSSKKLKLAKSAIHNWGIFAMETIIPGSIVVEYVGEKIRESVADARERGAEASGIKDSYFFRIDEDTIVDAGKSGNIARFINHNCQVSLQ